MVLLCIRDVLTPAQVIFGCFARFVQKKNKKMFYRLTQRSPHDIPIQTERADPWISKACRISCWPTSSIKCILRCIYTRESDRFCIFNRDSPSVSPFVSSWLFVFVISETALLLFSLRCKPSIYFSRDFESMVTWLSWALWFPLDMVGSSNSRGNKMPMASVTLRSWRHV